MKKVILIIFLAFISLIGKGQKFMSLEDLIQLSVCKQDEECWSPILKKYKFEPDLVNQEIFKESKNFHVFGVFKTSYLLEIKPDKDGDYNIIKFKTIYAKEAEQYYLELFKKNRYETQINNNITSYVKEDSKQMINFYILPIKIGQKDAVQIAVALIKKPMRVFSEYENVGEVTINNLEGKPIALSSFKGKHVIFNYWGATCKYCVEEFPKLKKMINELPPELKSSFEFVLVNTDENLNNWKKGIQKFGLQGFKNYNAGLDIYNNSVIAFNIKGTPTNVFVDNDGVLVTNRGHLAGEQAKQLMKIMYDVKK